MNQFRGHRRTGFTLIETVTALAISTVLFMALGSTVIVAARAIPSGTEPVISEGEISRGLALMASDIELATSVSKAAKSLTLEVPDRDGDAAPDTIVYDWSDGERMLTRSWNGNEPETVLGPLAIAVPMILKSDDQDTRVLFIIQLYDHQPAVRTLNVALLNQPESN